MPQGAAGREQAPLARGRRANALLVEPEVAVTLLGSAGWAAEEAARRLLVALSGLEQRPGNKEGRAGV